MSSSRGSSDSDGTRVSCTAGRFFTNLTMREALKYFTIFFDYKQKKKKQIIPSITQVTFFPNSFTSKQLLAIECPPV